MIDIENYIFDTLFTAITTDFPTASVSGLPTEIPSSFPFVQILEVGNSTYEKTQDNSLTEHHSRVQYEIDVFSNSSPGAKTQAKAIANKVDSTMQGLKFTRNMYQPVPNIDRTVFRIKLRYTAIVAEGVTTGSGQSAVTTHQIYRK